MSKKDVSIFNVLKKKNEFPIIFIGAGLSKRYINNYPTWEGLLRELWDIQSNGNDFFAYLSRIKESLLEKDPTLKKDTLRFLINTEAAQHIGKKIDALFFGENFKIDGLSQEDAFRKNISPFKQYLANKFSKYEIKKEPNIEEELVAFRKMLLKTRLIFTTNYDKFIETTYDHGSEHTLSTYVGQKGFFQATLGYAELFKIHGCVSEPTSLIINEEDYGKFSNHSVLISAKIISGMLHSPIIFLGYSLTDENIKNILKSFISSLDETERTQLKQKLIIIQYDQDAGNNINEEVLFLNDFQCFFTLIKTNNYLDVYNKLSEIDQGVTPLEIRRYQHIINELIVEEGKKGALEKVFVGITELPTDAEICNHNWIVSLGRETETNIPTLKDYIKDYINNKNIDITIALRFISTLTGNYPKLKYLTETNIKSSNLEDFEKKRLLKKLLIKDNLDWITSHAGTMIEDPTQKSIDDIKATSESIQRKDATVCHYITKFQLDDIKSYILYSLEQHDGNHQLDTHLRRLSVAYDILSNS